MSTLFNFFISFDKLMKERLVKAFYWLALIVITLEFFDAFLWDWLIDLLGFFPKFLLAIISLRLLCEYLIATFRINDNLSPDGGKGETADVDLIDEARKAAEVATAKAKDAAKSATEKTKTALDKTKDRTKDMTDSLSGKVGETVSKTKESVQSRTKTAQKTVKKTVKPDDVTIETPVKVKRKASPKTTKAKTSTKKTAPKKAVPKKTTTKKSNTKPKT